MVSLAHRVTYCSCALLGDAGIDDNGQQSKVALGKTEISLTLSNKHELPMDEKADIQSVVIR